MKLLVLLCIVGLALCCNRAVRSIDGSCNNVNNPDWGKSGIPLAVDEGQEFKDGISQRVDGPNERVVSNLVEADVNYGNPRFWTTQFRVTGPTPNRHKLNNLFATFVQFFSHDLSLTPLIFTGQGFADNFLIEMVNDSTDPLWAPGMSPPRTKLFARPSFGVTAGTFKAFNNNTAWLDGSQIYGSKDSVANGLRTFVDGKFKVGPNNTVPLLGATSSSNECGSFVDRTSGSGDFRSDITVGVTSLHTLFVREHNRQADKFKAANPTWTDEQIFQKARAYVIAVYQRIVFEEALPLLLGNRVRLGNYRYNPNANPNILNSFSTSAFRIIHDMINNPFIALLPDCTPLTFPVVPGTPFPPFIPEWERPSCVFDFWRESIRLYEDDPFIWGMLHQYSQEFDNKVTDLLRNVFFSPTGISAPGNLDIEASNVFRNRFHGVPNFNALRTYWRGQSLYQLPGCNQGATIDPLKCFLYITSNQSLAQTLRNLYKKVNKIDSYIGFLVEDKRHGSRISPTAAAIIAEQFQRIRDGDFFWYENRNNGLFTWKELEEIRRTTFGQLLERNIALPYYPKKAFLVLDDEDSCFPRGNNHHDDDDDDDDDDGDD